MEWQAYIRLSDDTEGGVKDGAEGQVTVKEAAVFNTGRVNEGTVRQEKGWEEGAQ